MIKKSIRLFSSYSDHRGYYGPPVYLPLEYAMRLAPAKPVEFTHPRDPKYTWNTGVNDFADVFPGLFGRGRKIPGVDYISGGGIICEIPPVPVYREQIWCMGHGHYVAQHPRIFISCPRGKVVCCKWCRLKFINMSTDEDNDDDWFEEEQKISTTPESKEDLFKPVRDMGGVIRKQRFQDNRSPDPYVYRAVFNPDRHRWRQRSTKHYEVHPAYATPKTGTTVNGTTNNNDSSNNNNSNNNNNNKMNEQNNSQHTHEDITNMESTIIDKK